MEGIDETWKCITCGKSHSDVPLSFAADFPDMYANLKSEDRDLRATIRAAFSSMMTCGFRLSRSSALP